MARHRWTALLVGLCATVVQLLDVSIVGVAAADIRATLRAPSSRVQLVLVGYQLGFACTLITAGRLGDVHGRRRMVLVGMVLVGMVLVGMVYEVAVFAVVVGLVAALPRLRPAPAESVASVATKGWMRA